MSLGFRREVRGRDIHWGTVKTEMVFKTKKLEAVVGVERKKRGQDQNSKELQCFKATRGQTDSGGPAKRTEKEGGKKNITP